MINWKEIPFVRFLLPFAAGIALSALLENNHPIWYGILIVFAAVRLLLAFRRLPFQYHWGHGFIANILLFLMGYLWCFHFNELQSENHFQTHLQEENIIIGKVMNTPEAGKYFKTLVEIQNIGTHPDSLKIAEGNLLVYLKNDSLNPINYGDVVVCKTRIQKVATSKNPHAFDYRRYLHFQNIHFQTFVNAPNDWQVIATQQGNFIDTKTIALRKHFVNILEKHLTSPYELAVGKALILGQKDDLNEEVRTAYSHTGALHVLAVSGLHVGLVAWFVNILLSLVKSRSLTWRRSKAAILIGVVWSFAMVTGGSPSVLRAATMFTFLIIGLSVDRTTNIYNSLAISATFLLAWNPYLLFNVGFQLSYLAVAGIVFFQPKIYIAWIPKSRFGRFIWRLITVSLGAQLGTLPISVYYFHLFPFYGWLSGIVVIPAATVILGSGMLLLVVESFLPVLAFIPGAMVSYSIWLMNIAIFFIQKFPFSVWLGLWISLGVVFLMYAMLGNIIMVFNAKKYRWLLPAAGFALLLAINYSFVSFGEIHQKKLFIYHSYRNTIIDFFDGKKGLSISNETVTEKNLSFATQNNRWANGIKKVHQLHFSKNQFQSENLFFQNSFIQFFDKKIALVEETFQLKNHSPIDVDFILIRNNPKINIADLSQNFRFQTIIFDCSNSQWKVEKWKTDCKNLNYSYYDIFEKGAFEISLE